MAERMTEENTFNGVHWMGSYGFQKVTERIPEALQRGMSSVSHEQTVTHQLGECDCG